MERINLQSILVPAAIIVAGILLQTNQIFGVSLTRFIGVPILIYGTLLLGKKILSYIFPSSKNRTQIILFVMTLFCGFIGYNKGIDYKNVLNSFYYTAQLFTINAPIVKTGKSDPAFYYSLWIELARWSAVLFIISAVLSHIYKITSDSIKLLKIGLLKRVANRQHVVINELNSASTLLARDLIEKGKEVVIIAKDDKHQDVDDLRGIGVTFVFGSALETSVLARAQVLESSHFILMEDNEANNIDVFMKVKYLLEQEKKIKTQIVNCLILIKDDRYNPIFEEMESEILDSDVLRQRLEFNLFNLNKLKAKLLFDNYPLYKDNSINIGNKAETQQAAHLVIIGFGNTGQQILLQAAKLGHFINGRPLHVTVIDKYAQDRKSSFLSRYKNMTKVCSIDFLQMDVNSLDLSKDKIVNNNTPPITYIAICLESDHLDFITGILLKESYKNIPIAIEVRDDIKLANWIHTNSGRFRNIYCFGDLKEIVSSKVIIDEALDNLAKTINDFYNKDNNPRMFWDKLTVFLKESNRAQADHIKTKLHAMGLEMKLNATDNDIILTKEGFLRHLQKYIEKLAKSEHERWCAFHYINGWDKKEHTGEGNHRDEKLKLHVCLVPWDELSDHYKEKDINAIKSLYEILTSSHYSICIKEEFLIDYWIND